MAKSRRVDDDEDDDDRPKRKKRPVDDDDDDEDERPVKKKRPVPVDDDEDEEEEDERPVKKPKKGKKKKKSNGMLIGLIVGGVLLFGLCGLGGFGAWYFFLSDSPKAAVEDFAKAVEKEDYGRMWDRLDKQSRQSFSSVIAIMKNGPDAAKYQGKSERDSFILAMNDAKTRSGGRTTPTGWNGKPTVKSVKVDGETAVVTIVESNGREMPVTCVKEDGGWRLSLRR